MARKKGKLIMEPNGTQPPKPKFCEWIPLRMILELITDFPAMQALTAVTTETFSVETPDAVWLWNTADNSWGRTELEIPDYASIMHAAKSKALSWPAVLGAANVPPDMYPSDYTSAQLRMLKRVVDTSSQPVMKNYICASCGATIDFDGPACQCANDA